MLYQLSYSRHVLFEVLNSLRCRLLGSCRIGFSQDLASTTRRHTPLPGTDPFNHPATAPRSTNRLPLTDPIRRDIWAPLSWAAAGRAAGGWPVFQQDPELKMRRPLSHRHCVRRAVKEMDSKSTGLCPQGFVSPRCRLISLGILPTRVTDANYNLKLRTRPTTTQVAYHGHQP